MTEEGMHLLRHSIVARACLDYDTAIRYMARPPEKQTGAGIIKHEAMIAECERFFRGSWFRCLCELDGETVMRAVRKNGYFCNTFVTHKPKDYNYKMEYQEAGTKRRDKRRKEMEEYEKRKKQGNEKGTAD